MGVGALPRHVLVAGSGAREHALAWACAQRHPDLRITCAPGNGGTAAFATNVPVAADDAHGIARLARETHAGLVVIGPDAALAAGVADACREERIAVFGPSRAAARIESSKEFAKSVMGAAGIPTARWCAGDAGDRATLTAFIAELHGRCVVKADGLALGKGVTVCEDVGEAVAAVSACLDEGRFGAAGNRVLIEERLSGPEVSAMALVDGTNLRLLPPSRDHKRIGDGDTGPNTGGMGAVTPPPGLDPALLDAIERDVLRPCVEALSAAGTPFSGCLYAGLMLTAEGLRVLEFNARFGDPETQVVLPVLEEDVLELLTACAHGALLPGTARRAPEGCAVGVVLAAAGYPGTPRRGDTITGLNTLGRDILAFHASTRVSDDGLVTDGGRVLTLVARDGSADGARQRVYSAVASVHFDGMQLRRDIGA